jgi:hypothetical protein
MITPLGVKMVKPDKNIPSELIVKSSEQLTKEVNKELEQEEHAQGSLNDLLRHSG